MYFQSHNSKSNSLLFFPKYWNVIFRHLSLEKWALLTHFWQNFDDYLGEISRKLPLIGGCKPPVVKGGLLGNNYISIKRCTTTFLWVLNFGQVGGRRKFFQNHTATMIFSKMVSKVIFWKNFTRDFPVKNEENFLLEIFT